VNVQWQYSDHNKIKKTDCSLATGAAQSPMLTVYISFRVKLRLY